jgi:hypothetical protein
MGGGRHLTTLWRKAVRLLMANFRHLNVSAALAYRMPAPKGNPKGYSDLSRTHADKRE